MAGRWRIAIIVIQTTQRIEDFRQQDRTTRAGDLSQPGFVFNGEGVECPGCEDAPLLDGLENLVGEHLPRMVIDGGQ